MCKGPVVREPDKGKGLRAGLGGELRVSEAPSPPQPSPHTKRASDPRPHGRGADVGPRATAVTGPARPAPGGGGQDSQVGGGREGLPAPALGRAQWRVWLGYPGR